MKKRNLLALEPLSLAVEPGWRGAYRAAFRSLDPRASLAASVGWSICVLSLVLAALTGMFTMRAARHAVEREIGQLYAAHAQRLIDTIDANLAGRRNWVATTGRLIGLTTSTESESLKTGILDDLRQTLPEIEWVGVADLSGTITEATDDVLVGERVDARPWFTSAFLGAFVGDVHPGLLLDRQLPRLIEGEPRRFVDLSAPIIDRTGDVKGILGVALGWSWIDALRLNAATMLAGRRSVEILLLGVDGTALLGSDQIPAGQRYNLARSEAPVPYLVEGDYLIGIAKSRGQGEFAGLGWTVIVREPTQSAFLPAVQASFSIFLAAALSGIVSAIGGAFVAQRIMRRLKGLARSADSLRLGQVQTLEAETGRDEVGRIGRSMRALVGTLQQTNSELAALNMELDSRVAARTRDLERMGHEAQRVAVTRERLRISRDLHDTLAHSMLAMLTQIRMIRKIAPVKPHLVEDELARAEEAAIEGLSQSRDAVTHLRYSPVREDGLGAALRRLATRMESKTGIDDAFGMAIEVDLQEQAAVLADEKTEAVYRIIEEAVRNVMTHAQASHMRIGARLIDKTLEIIVADDGVGFNPDARKEGHYGLVGIREQAELIGAALTIDSAPGRGTRLVMRVGV